MTPRWNTPEKYAPPPPIVSQEINPQKGPSPPNGQLPVQNPPPVIQNYHFSRPPPTPHQVGVMHQAGGPVIMQQQGHPPGPINNQVIYRSPPSNGRPQSQERMRSGSGVLVNQQPVHIVPRSIPGQVTPPQPITPLYAQPHQSQKHISHPQVQYQQP